MVPSGLSCNVGLQEQFLHRVFWLPQRVVTSQQILLVQQFQCDCLEKESVWDWLSTAGHHYLFIVVFLLLPFLWFLTYHVAFIFMTNLQQCGAKTESLLVDCLMFQQHASVSLGWRKLRDRTLEALTGPPINVTHCDRFL